LGLKGEKMSEESLKKEIIKLLDIFYTAEDDFEEEVENLTDKLAELVGYNDLEEE
jgi:hypothetical protein